MLTRELIKPMERPPPSIFLNMLPLMPLKSCFVSLNISYFPTIYTAHITNAINCARTVAIAAPLTPSFNITTKNMSPATLSITDTARIIRGVIVSPIARKTAAHISYKNVARSPAIITDIYALASPDKSCGILRNLSIGQRNISPAAVIIRAIETPSISAAAKDFFTAFISLAPNFCAVTMAKPLDSPRRKPIIRLLSVVVEPTAASIFSPRNVPTILVSTILYVSCKRFARNTGNANDNIRTDGFPFVRSFII